VRKSAGIRVVSIVIAGGFLGTGIACPRSPSTRHAAEDIPKRKYLREVFDFEEPIEYHYRLFEGPAGTNADEEPMYQVVFRPSEERYMALMCTLAGAPFRRLTPQEEIVPLGLDAAEPSRHISMLIQEGPRGTVRLVMHTIGFVRLETPDGAVTTLRGDPPLGCILHLCVPASQGATEGDET
jgi:hypothetical protein